MRIKGLLLLAGMIVSLALAAQKKKPEPTIPAEYCISTEELELYRIINQYRFEKGLNVIPLSRSLSFVAYTHVRDLSRNRPDFASCNLHSWSNKGSWTACCYAKDPNRSQCMAGKPRELTRYKGDGQELILWENKRITPSEALQQWKELAPTNDILIKEGRWAGKNWQAMGVAMFEGYVSVWFGEMPDEELFVRTCTGLRQISQTYLLEELGQLVTQNPAALPSEPRPATTVSGDPPPGKDVKPAESNPPVPSNTKPPATAPKTGTVPAKPQTTNSPGKPVSDTIKQAVGQNKDLEVKPPADQKPVKEEPSALTRYYLVVSSFATEQQARRELQNLVRGGYTDARIIQNDGKFRVSIYDYPTEAQAKEMQQQLKDVFKGIWVMAR